MLADLIIGVRFRDTASGKLAMATLDDRGGRVDVIVDASLIEQYRDLRKPRRYWWSKANYRLMILMAATASVRMRCLIWLRLVNGSPVVC